MTTSTEARPNSIRVTDPTQLLSMAFEAELKRWQEQTRQVNAMNAVKEALEELDDAIFSSSIVFDVRDILKLIMEPEYIEKLDACMEALYHRDEPFDHETVTPEEFKAWYSQFL